MNIKELVFFRKNEFYCGVEIIYGINQFLLQCATYEAHIKISMLHYPLFERHSTIGPTSQLVVKPHHNRFWGPL